MPGCCVPGCNNRSESGFRLFRIPSDRNNPERTQLWLNFINRNVVPSRATVCEAHFEETEFEVNRVDEKKLLKKNAVPTVTVEYLQSRGLKRKINDDYARTFNLIEEEAPSQSTASNIDSDPSGEPEVCEETYVNNLQFKKLKLQLHAAETANQELKKQVKKLEEKFKEIFNEDQLHMLKYGNHRGTQWSHETIQKALKLYMACGTKGYAELIRQKYPLPSIRTLQHQTQSFKVEAGVLEASGTK